MSHQRGTDEVTPAHAPPEWWGGIECSVTRVGDRYYDQLQRSGHAWRIDDLDQFAALGFRALRYPVLWERTAPDGLDSADWSWPTARLGRLRTLGLRPIVGLVHHGSGPFRTSLVDPAFPMEFAGYAAEVARHFPWIEDYTPVNEPLTTARFSALYGHWYPHASDDASFGQALLNQCRAVVLGMQAIRQVNSAARLAQTEDLAKTFSTPLLRYQADFENERRWLTFDLLCGRVERSHPMWDYLTGMAGLPEADVLWFRDHPCPPNVMGINYYMTSERFLDERLDRYPISAHGGNGRHRYADVEAVRACATGPAGAESLLREAADRYGLPIAVTEAHLGCTRDEQLRWLKEVWSTVCRLSESGVDVRAMTAWALLGSHDWDSLMCRPRGHYEPGVFDIRAAKPRRTALAHWIKAVIAGDGADHPVLAEPGWWRRPSRLLYPAVHAYPRAEPTDLPVSGSGRRSVVVIGELCDLTGALVKAARQRGLSCRLVSHQALDMACAETIEKTFDKWRPWAVISACNTLEPIPGKASQFDGPRGEENGVLADLCARRGAPLLTFSSGHVFNGLADRPYRESDEVSPVDAFGRALVEREKSVLNRCPQALVARVGLLFGPLDEAQPRRAGRTLEEQIRSLTARDQFSVTYLPELAHVCFDLLCDAESGVWHLTNGGVATAREVTRALCEICEAMPPHCQSLRPGGLQSCVLMSERAQLMSGWEQALRRYHAAVHGDECLQPSQRRFL